MMKNDDYEKKIRYGVAVNATINSWVQQGLFPGDEQSLVDGKTERLFVAEVVRWKHLVDVAWDDFNNADQKELEQESDAILEELEL